MRKTRDTQAPRNLLSWGTKLIDQLADKMKSIGGSVDEYDDFFCLDAPSGYVWRSNGNTSMQITFRNGAGQSWLAKAIRDEMDNIRMGFQKVTDAARIAEIRHLLDDDNWGATGEAPETLAWPA